MALVRTHSAPSEDSSSSSPIARSLDDCERQSRFTRIQEYFRGLVGNAIQTQRHAQPQEEARAGVLIPAMQAAAPGTLERVMSGEEEMEIRSLLDGLADVRATTPAEMEMNIASLVDGLAEVVLATEAPEVLAVPPIVLAPGGDEAGASFARLTTQYPSTVNMFAAPPLVAMAEPTDPSPRVHDEQQCGQW